MNITIPIKLDLMVKNARTGFLLVAVFSFIFMLSACSAAPERSSGSEPVPVLAPANVASSAVAESEPISELALDLVADVSRSQKKQSGSVEKLVVENKAPKLSTNKPLLNKQRVKKGVKVPVVSKKLENKSLESIKLLSSKQKIEPAKPLVDTESIVDPTKAITAMPNYEVDLAKLPLFIGANWTLSRDVNANGRCALSYRKVVMNDGQGETPVMVIITQDELQFKTKSNIDMSYLQTGITIDEHPQLPIEKLLNDFSITYETQYLSLIERMKTGNQAVLTLGFWPSWPVTHTYSISLELGEFSAAQQALMVCLALEKELK